jgi:CTD small phosphatase-like protein 2
VCLITDGQLIQHRLFRESCLEVEGDFLKDLNILGRDLSKTVMVDNSPHAFGYQLDNGIPIESWFDDPTDDELVKLGQFLRLQVLPAKDVREVVRKKYQSHAKVAACLS